MVWSSCVAAEGCRFGEWAESWTANGLQFLESRIVGVVEREITRIEGHLTSSDPLGGIEKCTQIGKKRNVVEILE